jgi:tetratricopeptide (TPR) repeat protein
MKKPVRHSSHILETKSRKFFEAQLPDDWIFNIPANDYGLDYHIEVVLKNEVTGLNFSVQLKSRKTKVNKPYCSASLKHSTLNYFHVRLEPVMLISFVEEEQEAYWIWMDELKLDLSQSKDTYSIQIPKANKLSKIDWNNTLTYVQEIFNKRSFIGEFNITELTNAEVIAWRTYYGDGFQQSIFLFRELLKKDSGNIPMRQALAWSLHMTYQYAEALKVINELLRTNPSARNYQTKACILAEFGFKENDKGKIIQAKNLFQQYIDQEADGLMLYNYANTLIGLANYEEAIRNYKLSLEKNQNYAECWKNLGTCFYHIGNHEEEMNCYDRALAIEPALPEALISKGITLIKIYSRYKDALILFNQVQDLDDVLYDSFVYGFFWLAFVHEKLDHVEEALKWIDKGLDQEPTNLHFLNFKSNLLAKYWKKHRLLKIAAIKFFEFRFELQKDIKSLYYLIQIKSISKKAAFTLIQSRTDLLNGITLKLLDEYELKWESVVEVLLYWESYRKFRNEYPLSRYTEQLLSQHNSIPTQFWGLLNLVCSISFSQAQKKYNKTKQSLSVPVQISKILLEEVPKLIREIFPSMKYPQKIAVELFSFFYVHYSIIISREIGLQTGYISAQLNLPEMDSEEYLQNNWHVELHASIAFHLNRQLNLLEK